MIKIKRITPQTVELFGPDKKAMGFVNEHELLTVCLQIKKEKAEGYYVLFGDREIKILPNGRFEKLMIDGFFDTTFKLLSAILFD